MTGMSKKNEPECGKGERKVSEDMTRLEILTLLLSLKALLESNNTEKALELIDEVIAEAKYKGN